MRCGTACEFPGHRNQREDGQHILAGVVSTSVAQACKMEKKEPKDEQTNASTPGQTISCHSLYINGIMRLSMPDDAAATKIAALANALQAYAGDDSQQEDSIYADSVDIPIVLNMVGICSYGAQPMMLLSGSSREPRRSMRMPSMVCANH